MGCYHNRLYSVKAGVHWGKWAWDSITKRSDEAECRLRRRERRWTRESYSEME